MGAMNCAWCGKAFTITSAGWGYAYAGRYTCSYRCMRKMEEEDSVTEEQKRIVDELEGKGLTAKAIAEQAGVNPQNVYDYQRKKRQEAGGAERQDGGPEEKPERAETGKKAKPAEKPEEKQTVPDRRYTVGWMCPCCGTVWNPYISACTCSRTKNGGGDGA